MNKINTPPPEYPENAAYRRNSKALDFAQRQAMDHAAQNRDMMERAQRERTHSGMALLFATGVGALLDEVTWIWAISFFVLVWTSVRITLKSMEITQAGNWKHPPAASEWSKGLMGIRSPEQFIKGLVDVQNDVNIANEAHLAQKNTLYVDLQRLVQRQMRSLVFFVLVSGITLALSETGKWGIPALWGLWGSGLFG